jgi:hypothetical protein
MDGEVIERQRELREGEMKVGCEGEEIVVPDFSTHSLELRLKEPVNTSLEYFVFEAEEVKEQ